MADNAGVNFFLSNLNSIEVMIMVFVNWGLIAILGGALLLLVIIAILIVVLLKK
ncbi:Uncharacterised protein [Chlamydia abortus]|uniref:Dihydroorotate dehydrogenase n=1 Tax=Paenibacillus residui TaxID=629724 RepID=A0ABW3D5D9_9BACL|nr:hypothetical protein [Paenibacillus sp. 32O-W]SHE13355.1 Uncharacterised protein [Chlamydia abortus]